MKRRVQRSAGVALERLDRQAGRAPGLKAAVEIRRPVVPELLACAPLAVGHVKRVLDGAAKPALAATLEHEVAVQELCARTDVVTLVAKILASAPKVNEAAR